VCVLLCNVVSLLLVPLFSLRSCRTRLYLGSNLLVLLQREITSRCGGLKMNLDLILKVIRKSYSRYKVDAGWSLVCSNDDGCT